MHTHKLTDVDGHFADRSTRYLMTALFGEQEESDWRDDALCAEVDGDAFFPEKGGSTQTPKAVCARCPVRAECLDYALENREPHGVWGGLGENERRALVRTAA